MAPGTDMAGALAALQWQIELGADEAILESPVNRFETAPAPQATPQAAPKPAPDPIPAPQSAAPPPAAAASVDPVAEARALAAAAEDLPALHAAIAGFAHCALRRGARNTVFADGTPAARVMIVGEAPGREEDLEGRPFVGAAGRLLDRMLAAIGLSRQSPDPASAVYIANVIPWRPPRNRDPEPDEISMMLPFLERHVALADPDLIVPMGNISCQALLGQRGITRLRGTWTEVFGRPALPMFHPAYLLRSPERKSESWADLLDLKARLVERN